MASNAWYCCGSSPAARALRSLKFRYRRIAYRKSASASKLKRSLLGLDISKHDYIVFRCKLSLFGQTCAAGNNTCGSTRECPQAIFLHKHRNFRTQRFCRLRVRRINTRNSCGSILKRLSKRLLRLHVLVSQPLVKCVRAFTNHIRSQRNDLASMLPRPSFSPLHQQLADPERPLLAIHHQPANFSPRLRFHRPKQKHMKKSRQSPVSHRRNE